MEPGSEESVRVAVLDYGMGNLRSVANAFEKTGAFVSVLDRPSPDVSWDAMVLPGVGALHDCVEGLRKSGLADWVRDWVEADRPFFGICLGLQALFNHSEEGNAAGLGIFPGRVVRFRIDSSLKVPHMGWNSVSFRDAAADPLCGGLRPEEQFYFDHTYHVVPEDPSLIWGETDYGGRFVSAIRRGNCFATQFHPEKSQAKGLQMYANFLKHTVNRKHSTSH